MDAVAAEQVWKSYHGVPVLRDVSFRVPSGGRLVLSAPSGTGKTTLLRLLLRLETPDRGTIRSPDRWTAVFQEDRLLDHLGGIQNLRLVLGRYYREDRTLELLDALGLNTPGLNDTAKLSGTATTERTARLDGTPGKPVRTWSGGMRRRLALARALLAPSDAVALDEPFTGLDADSRRRCIEAIDRLSAGRTILLASHNPADAADLGAAVLELPR